MYLQRAKVTKQQAIAVIFFDNGHHCFRLYGGCKNTNSFSDQICINCFQFLANMQNKTQHNILMTKNMKPPESNT